MNWHQLSVEDARRHPRYGLAGWLYLVLALIAFALVADAVEWSQYGPGSDRPRWLIAATITLHLGLLVAGVRKWRYFPEAAIAVLWLAGGLGQIYSEHAAVGLAAEGPTVEPRYVGLVAFVALSLLVTWFLLTSERVNVTYKHRCRAAR